MKYCRSITESLEQDISDMESMLNLIRSKDLCTISVSSSKLAADVFQRLYFSLERILVQDIEPPTPLAIILLPLQLNNPFPFLITTPQILPFGALSESSRESLPVVTRCWMHTIIA